MALWVCRAGKRGEYELRFREENVIYCTWDNLDWNMLQFDDRELFKENVRRTFPSISDKLLGNWTGQLWSFSRRMKKGDIVALPSKINPVIYFGEITSDYTFSPDADMYYQHARKVKWIKEIKRRELDQDLRFSFGSTLTIYRINRNDAEQRIRELLGVSTRTQIRAEQSQLQDELTLDDMEEIDTVDIEEAALQEIADAIIAKYKGHGLAKVIAAILEAKGYKTYVSKPGPDNGVDILASQGSLGFDAPRICVQVKSGDNPLERTVLDQLIGAMSNHKADYGMLVSWGGFKSSIIKEEASQFFKVRLWTHKEIIEEFLQHYESLPEDIKEAIPLKRIWIIDKKEI